MKKLILGILGFIVIVSLIGAIGCGTSNDPTMFSIGGGESVGAPDTHPVPMTTVVPTITAPPVVTMEQTPPVIVTEAPSLDKGDGAYSDVSGAIYATSTDRMVVRTAFMTLVVDDVSETLQQITAFAESYGGYVVNSSISEDRNRLYAYITFRVDTTHFNGTLQHLRDMAVDVKSESTTGTDVTEQYTDLESRLRNLEASEAQLLKLMDMAGTVEEILEVQRELTNTREDIELIIGQMQYLEQSAALASFTVTLEQSKLVIDFTAETRTVKEGQKIQFYASVSGGFSPYTYEWDFGDGETSTETNPAHIYNSGGDFTVSLKVTDDKGTIETYEREAYITVIPDWSAGSIVDSAWNGFVNFFRAIGSFFIRVAVWSPLWIIILVALYFGWRYLRKKRKVEKIS